MKRSLLLVLLMVVLAGFSQLLSVSSFSSVDMGLLGDVGVALDAGVDFTVFHGSIDYSLVEDHVWFFASQGSRISGYPGCDAAADYIYNYFQDIGLSNVSYDPFQVTVPVDYGAFLEIEDGSSFTLYPMEPNLVCPVMADDLSGPLIYVGRGSLEELEGKPIGGSIVLMDYVSDMNWLRAAKAGAKAAIFLEPDPQSPLPTIFENQKKTSWIPFNFPRLYMKLEDFVDLLPLLNFNLENPTLASITSKVVWETRQASNIIGVVEGEEEGVIIYSSYYDSYSSVLSVAPGANDAFGVSVLLEVARLFTNPQYKPKYTIMFIAYAGHHQVLAGARHFYTNTLSLRKEEPLIPILQVNLQITTLTNGLVTENGGNFINYAGGHRSGVIPYEDEAYEDLDLFVRQIIWGTIRNQTFLNATVSFRSGCSGGFGQGSPWYEFMDDAEVLAMNGGPGYMIQTDYYAYTAFSPFDDMNLINKFNLKGNTALAASLLYGLAQTSDLPDLVTKFNRSIYTQHINGRVSFYNQTSQEYTRIPNAVVVAWHQEWPKRMVTFSNENGSYNFYEIRSTAQGPGLVVRAYVVDEDTGEITWAPTLGSNQIFDGRTGGTGVMMEWIGAGTYVLFECASIILFDGVDPDSLSTHQRFRVIDMFTMTPAIDYGYEYYSSSAQRVTDDSTIQASLFGVVRIYLPPETEVSVIMPTRTTARRIAIPQAVLSNATEDNRDGYGYFLEAGEVYYLSNAASEFAEDTLYRASKYFDILKAKGLVSTKLDEEKGLVFELLENASDAFLDYAYAESYYYQVKAWVTSQSIYGQIASIYTDTTSVMPYFAMMLVPFVLLVERLALPEVEWKKRIVFILSLFAVTYASFSLMHPSFYLAPNPYLVIIVFITMILIIPVLYSTYRSVFDMLKELQMKISGIHFIEVSRGSAVYLAFQLGTQNLKRRRLRTILTLLTIMMITMGIVLFSSISTIKQTSVASYKYETPYTEVLVRGQEGEEGPNLGTNIVDFIKGGYGDVATVTPVTWHYISRNMTHIETGGSWRVYVLMGLSTIVEHQVLMFNLTGRWFAPGEMYSCIVPSSVTDYLNASLGDHVEVMGKNLTIIGIADATLMMALTDMVGIPITPLDFTEQVDEGTPRPHVPPEEVLIVPLEFTQQWGRSGGQYSRNYPAIVQIEIVASDPEDVVNIGLDLYSLMPLFTIIGGTAESVVMFSRSVTTTVFGWQMQLIPIVLASFMILNLLLGGIKERERDIFVFSSVGLSPLHITFMFLAEASIYAVVGGLLGYVAGMGVYQVMPLVSDVTLAVNYSSGFVTVCLGLIMLLTLISSIYPAFKASRLITPSLERSWKIPTKAYGNIWEIPIPVVFKDQEDVNGAYKYMEEHVLSQAGEYGYFSPEGGVKIDKKEEASELTVITRLAPYDQGVTHEFKLRVETGKLTPTMILQRKTGQRDAWLRLVRRFATEIRRQLLLWKTLPEKERERYK